MAKEAEYLKIGLVLKIGLFPKKYRDYYKSLPCETKEEKEEIKQTLIKIGLIVYTVRGFFAFIIFSILYAWEFNSGSSFDIYIQNPPSILKIADKAADDILDFFIAIPMFICAACYFIRLVLGWMIGIDNSPKGL